jgi:hypothetical protein
MSSSEGEEIVIMSLLREEEQKKKRKRRRFWVHNMCKKKMIHGEFHSLYPDLLKMRQNFLSIFGLLMDSLLNINFNFCIRCYFTTEQKGNNSVAGRQTPEHDTQL